MGLPANLRDIFKYKDWTVLALYKWRSDTNGVLIGTQDGSTYDSFRLYEDGTVRWRDADYEPNQAYTDIDVGDYDVFHAMGDSTTIYGFRNGSLISTGDISFMNEPINIDSSSDLPLGANDDEGALDNFMDMELSCVLIYDAKLSDDDAKAQADAIFNSLLYQRPAEISIGSPSAAVGSAAIEPIVIPIIVPTETEAHFGFSPSWDANQIFVSLTRSASFPLTPIADFHLTASGGESAFELGTHTAEIAAPVPVIRTATDGISPLVPYMNIASAPSAVRSLVVSPDVGYPIWATGSAVAAEAPIRNFVNNAPLGSISSLGRAWWRWDADPVRARILYRVVLTGAADGVPDVDLPATHIHVRRREDKELSYIEVETAPLADTAARIADRSSGQILVDRGLSVGLGWHWIRIAEARLDDVEVLRERRFRLSGRGSELEPADRTMVLRPSYRSEENEELRLRSAVDPFLAPGDRVDFQGRVVTVREISYYIAVSDEEMETLGS